MACVRNVLGPLISYLSGYSGIIAIPIDESRLPLSTVKVWLSPEEDVKSMRFTSLAMRMDNSSMIASSIIPILIPCKILLKVSYVIPISFLFPAFPEKPVGVRFKERKDGGLLVKWDKSRSPELTSPVIYILRWWCPYTPEVLYSIVSL